MSKTSNNTPYSNGSFSINGQTKATTVKNGGTVYGNYNMNQYEKALYDYAQKTLSEIVPDLNTFSNATLNNIQAQLNAYQNKGQTAINSMYAPLLENLKNDIASRFGNFDNSMFLNNLKNIESSRSNAIAQLTENLLSKRNELVNDELANRYNYINLLNSLQSQMGAEALNSISTALNIANSARGLYSTGGNSKSAVNTQAMLSLMKAFL